MSSVDASLGNHASAFHQRRSSGGCCPPRPRSRRPSLRHRLFEMAAVARLDHHLEQRGLGRQVGEGALVVDLDDVGARLAQDVGDPGRACPAGRPDRWRAGVRRPSRANSRVSTLASSRVSMLPPHSTMPTVRPLKRSRCAHTAARPAAPAPSTTVFSMLMSRLTAFSICGSDTSTMSSTSCAHDRLRDSARRLDGDALGQRIAAHRQGFAFDRVVHRGIERRLHADHPQVRLAAPWRRWPSPKSARRRRSAPPACRSRAPRPASPARRCPVRRSPADRRRGG